MRIVSFILLLITLSCHTQEKPCDDHKAIIVEHDGVINSSRNGVISNSNSDVTYCIQRLINHASKNNLKLYLPKGNYYVSNLKVKNGIKEIYGERGTKIISLKNSGEAVFEFDGDWFNQPAVVGVKFHDLTIDCNNVARRALFLAGKSNSNQIYNLDIFGLENPQISETAIYLHFGTTKNKIFQNKIKLGKSLSSLVGIHLVGETVDPQANWGRSVITKATKPSDYNLVEYNKISGGTHGIALFAADNNGIRFNQLNEQSQRGIILSPLSSFNEVSRNKIYDFGSSGIHLAYRSSNNVILKNELEAPNSNGEGGIQAYVGCDNNLIQDNNVNCGSNYGIYLAISVSRNIIVRNTISGPVKKAMICIENDWVNLGKKRSSSARPNYALPPNNIKNWALGNSILNQITENRIENNRKEIPNISLVESGKDDLKNNTIKGNKLINGNAVLPIFEKN